MSSYNSTSNQPIYLITDGWRLRSSGLLVEAVCSALEGAGGAIGAVQLREQVVPSISETGQKPATDEDVIALYNQLRPICESHRAKLLINRRVDLAKRLGADGVHLPSDNLDIQGARNVLGENSRIGISVHSIEEAKHAAKQNPDYILFGPVFPPHSKPLTREPLGIANLKEAVGEVTCPIYALGGMDRDRTSQVAESGACGVAIIGSVLLSTDPRNAAKEIAQKWFAWVSSVNA